MCDCDSQSQRKMPSFIWIHIILCSFRFCCLHCICFFFVAVSNSIYNRNRMDLSSVRIYHMNSFLRYRSILVWTDRLIRIRQFEIIVSECFTAVFAFCLFGACWLHRIYSVAWTLCCHLHTLYMYRMNLLEIVYYSKCFWFLPPPLSYVAFRVGYESLHTFHYSGWFLIIFNYK